MLPWKEREDYRLHRLRLQASSRRSHASNQPPLARRQNRRVMHRRFEGSAAQSRPAETFCYFTTKTALPYAKDVLARLVSTIDSSVAVLDVDSRCRRWDDGLVIKLRTTLTPKDLASKWRGTLHDLDRWAIFNLEGSAPAELGGMGSITSFLSRPVTRGVLQIMVLYRPEDRLHHITEDLLRKRLPNSQLGFPFRNGRMLLLDSNEEIRTTERRLDGLWVEWAVACPARGQSVRLFQHSDDPWRRVNFSDATVTECVELITSVRRRAA